MARKKVKLDDDEAQVITFKAFNRLSNFVMLANTELAKQFGRFPKFDETKWAEGVLPYDLGNEILKEKFGHLYDKKMDAVIRQRIAEHGVRNALMMAVAPTASSATSRDLTESIEPIMYFSYELEGAVTTQVLVPEFSELNQYYSLAYETDQFKLVILNAIRQLFIDQSQSFNMYIAPENWNKEYLWKLRSLAHKLGVKTLYYTNTPKNAEHETCESCSA
jgi:ribonucleoside-diphosphate reductase alpha chain